MQDTSLFQIPDVMRSEGLEIASDLAMTRLCDEAAAFAQFVETTRVSRELVAMARLVRDEAVRTRELVVLDRERRAHQAEARARLRATVSEYVAELKRAGSSLDSVFRMTGHLMHRLRITGWVIDDEGSLEVEIQRMVAEEYVAAA